jgi:hypothetical protein
MLQAKLITKDDVRQFKQISVTLDDDDIIFDQFIIDAQIQDVGPLLGEELFNAVLKTPEDYEDLLNGGEYTVDGKTYTNYGLKAVLAHYAYARYRYFGAAVDTPYGFVEKQEGADSRADNQQTKIKVYNLNRDSAFTIWGSVENYLVRMQVPLYGSNGCRTHRSPNGIKLSKITKFQ